MAGARTGVLASLQGAISRLEMTRGERLAERVPLGHAPADAALKGGLALGAMHEVFAQEARQGAVATGFILGLVHRVTRNKRFVLWITQEFAGREAGDLAMAGFAELGFDPRHIIVVRAANAEMALRVAADALACNALGAVVTELWGEPKAFDAVASRKLTLTAGTSGVTGLMLRFAADPEVSTAETRWILRAARSPPAPVFNAWGEPVFDAELVRNRHGPTGRWLMQWNCDDHLFHEQAAHSEPLVPKTAYRPLQAAGVAEFKVAVGGRR